MHRWSLQEDDASRHRFWSRSLVYQFELSVQKETEWLHEVSGQICSSGFREHQLCILSSHLLEVNLSPAERAAPLGAEPWRSQANSFSLTLCQQLRRHVPSTDFLAAKSLKAQRLSWKRDKGQQSCQPSVLVRLCWESTHSLVLPQVVGTLHIDSREDLGHLDMIKQPVYSNACDNSRDRATLGTPVLGFSGLRWNVLQVLGPSASPFFCAPLCASSASPFLSPCCILSTAW